MSWMAGKIVRIVISLVIVVFLSLAFVAYLQYREIKEALVAHLAARATEFIGQRVSIGDLSIGPGGTIALYDITVHNPENFPPGHILTIRKLSLGPRYRALLKKTLSFAEITVQKPELTLVRDSEGRFNISEQLKELFKRKPTLRYHIDSFAIEDGSIDINNDQRIRQQEVNLVIRDISSERDMKTSIRGETTSLWGRISMDGWVYLKQEPKRLNISLAARDVSLSFMEKALLNYGLGISRTKSTLSANIEGDTKEGFHVTTEVIVKDTAFRLLKQDVKEIVAVVDANVNLSERILRINNVSMRAGGVTAANLAGEMKQREGDIFYTALVNVHDLDLSAINFLKEVTIGGIVNAERVSVTGSIKAPLPEVRGLILLKKGRFERRDIAIGRLDAELRLSSLEKAHLAASVNDVRYGSQTFPSLRITSGISYRDVTLRLDGIGIASQELTASASMVTLALGAIGSQREVKARVNGFHMSYPSMKAAVTNADIQATVEKTAASLSVDGVLQANEVTYGEVSISSLTARGTIHGNAYSIEDAQAYFSGGKVRVTAQGNFGNNVFPLVLTVNAQNIDLQKLPKHIGAYNILSHVPSGKVETCEFDGRIESTDSVRGRAMVQAGGISIIDNKGRSLVRDGVLKADVDFAGNDIALKANAKNGSIAVALSGTITDFLQKKRKAEVQITVPAINMADIRETLWEIFPDGLLYVGLGGAISSNIAIRYANPEISVNGSLKLNNVTLTGENNEYFLGPITGVLPVRYVIGDEKRNLPELPSFDKTEFADLRTRYSEMKATDGYRLISIGSVRYGFPLLDDVKLWIKPGEKFLHVGLFSGNIFGGTIRGSAVIDLGNRFGYKIGFLVDDVSLSELCDRIEPIRGYLSGMLRGTAAIKGEGAGISALIGKADFWTYSAKRERTKISREFLQRVGGPSLKRYIGDRRFDTGVMSVYIQKGYLIFRELEISNRNFFGLKDLDIKVAPLNNRISVDHLLWSITEAAYRAKEKK